MVKIVRSESFKYPDEIRYFSPAALVEDNPNYLMLFMPPGAPTWNGKIGQLYRLRFNSLAILYPDRDYNVILFWTADWQFLDYYVNIAFPAKWDGEVASYVDLDLDVRWLPDHSLRVLQGEKVAGIEILDRDEYEIRSQEYNYSPELMVRIEKAVEEVVQEINLRNFPFDDSLLNWRPTPEMLTLADLPDSAAMWHL